MFWKNVTNAVLKLVWETCKQWGYYLQILVEEIILKFLWTDMCVVSIVNVSLHDFHVIKGKCDLWKVGDYWYRDRHNFIWSLKQTY